MTAAFLAACGRGEESSAASDSASRSMTTTTRQTRPAVTDDTLRVAVIGDSLAYGAGDEARKGIPVRLSEQLRRNGVDAPEVLNLGINGDTTAGVNARMQQPRVRTALAQADAIVLSIGANDLFRAPGGREEVMRAPFAVAEKILGSVEKIVLQLRALNPTARIFLLGGYNPVPGHPFSPVIEQYLTLWDAALAARFEADPRIEVVRLSDIINGPSRLSRFDHFHPGGTAYEETAKRIAGRLLEERAA